LSPPRWWNENDFAAWLAGKSVPVRPTADVVEPSRRVQAHVGIRTDTFTAKEGVLFSHDVVETLEQTAEWAIGVEARLPDKQQPTIARLGSDGRLVRIELLPEALFDPPEQVLEAFRATSPGLRVVVVTAACFAQGWLPDGLASKGKEYRGELSGIDVEVILRAAFVPRPLHVSGWDMAMGTPKPTSRMVPPGAVYFFERVDGQPFDEGSVRKLWLSSLGARTHEGFGRVVVGVWTPKRSQ